MQHSSRFTRGIQHSNLQAPIVRPALKHGNSIQRLATENLARPHHHGRERLWRRRNGLRTARCYAHTAAASSLFTAFQGGATSIAAYLETANPLSYLIYMLAAGVGLPCSEDALVVWVGQGIFLGRYGGAPGIAQVLAIVYLGVTVSDMITFYMGVALRHGLFKSIKNNLFRDPAAVERAEHAVQRWSKAIGLVQRFSLGFRGPICLFAGLLGVKPSVFGAGVAVGAFGTMALQITAGYFLRYTNAYLAAFALVTGPNAFGHVVGPVLTALGMWNASKDRSDKSNRPANADPSLPRPT